MPKGNFTTERPIKHGLCDHRLYGMWDYIKQSCTNRKSSSWKTIGSRGIKMCSDWSNSFLSFYHWALDSGWKQYYHIRRIDMDKDFTPENCKIIEGKKRLSRFETGARSHRKKSDDYW